MSRTPIAELVASAVAAAPLSESFDSLDDHSQQHLARSAEALGLTPAEHYEQIKAATEASTADDELVRQIALSTRRR